MAPRRRVADLTERRVARQLDELAERIKALPEDRQQLVETWLTKSFYTVPETAELLGVHPETVRRNIRSGRIKAFKVGGGSGPWRITAKELERLIQRGA